MGVIDSQLCDERVDFSACKKQNARKRLGIDLRAKNYIDSNDKVTGVSWSVEPGINKASDGFNDDKVWVLLDGGTIGETYLATANVTCQLGESLVFTISVTVE